MNTDNMTFSFHHTDLMSIQDGGNDNKFVELILKSFNDKKPEIAEYILQNYQTSLQNINITDSSNRNILHYLVIYAYNLTFDNILMQFLNHYDVKDLLNKKDKLGNTPLHYAVLFQNDELANLLIDKGADKSIKNNAGEYVATDNDTDKPEIRKSVRPVSREKKEADKKDVKASVNSDIFLDRTPEDVDEIIVMKPKGEKEDFATVIASIVSSSRKPIKKREGNTTKSFDFSRSILETDRNIPALINMEETINTKDTKDTDAEVREFLQMMKETDANSTIPSIEINREVEMPVQELTVPPRPGLISSIDREDKEDKGTSRGDPTTAQMLDDILEPKKMSGGGKKNKSKGRRKVKTLSEISFNNYSEELTDQLSDKLSDKLSEKLSKGSLKSKKNKSKTKPKITELTSELSSIARNIARQSTDIHERVIVKIASIMNLNLENPDEAKKARYYKAAIWRMINQKHPELSNFDRSVEMEKSITKDLLSSIDIKKVSIEIEKHLSEKSQSTKSEKSEKLNEKSTKEKPKKIMKEKETKKSSNKKTKNEGFISDKTLSISTESSISLSSTSAE